MRVLMVSVIIPSAFSALQRSWVLAMPSSSKRRSDFRRVRARLRSSRSDGVVKAIAWQGGQSTVERMKVEIDIGLL